MTVARTRRPSPEPDDRHTTRRPSYNQTTVLQPDDRPTTRRPPYNQTTVLNQTTVTRTRQRPIERLAREHYERFNQSIDRIEPELRYRPVAESNQGLLGRHPRRPQPANAYRERFESIQSIKSGRAFDRADPSPELNQTLTQAGRQACR